MTAAASGTAEARRAGRRRRSRRSRAPGGQPPQAARRGDVEQRRRRRRRRRASNGSAAPSARRRGRTASDAAVGAARALENAYRAPGSSVGSASAAAGRQGATDNGAVVTVIVASGPIIGSPYALVSPFGSSANVTGVADGKPGDARPHEGVRGAGAAERQAVVEDVDRRTADRSSPVGHVGPGDGDGRVGLGDGRCRRRCPRCARRRAGGRRRSRSRAGRAAPSRRRPRRRPRLQTTLGVPSTCPQHLEQHRRAVRRLGLLPAAERGDDGRATSRQRARASSIARAVSITRRPGVASLSCAREPAADRGPRRRTIRGSPTTASSRSATSNAEGGRFVAESERVVRRLVGSGLRVHSVLLTPPRLRRWPTRSAGPFPVYLAAQPRARRASPASTSTAAAWPSASARRRAPLPRGARALVVLEDLTDVDNLGAIARHAAAFGADALLLSPRCADPFYRKAIRVSLGAVFTLPIVRARALARRSRRAARRRASRSSAPCVDPGATPLARFAPPRALRAAARRRGARACRRRRAPPATTW